MACSRASLRVVGSSTAAPRSEPGAPPRSRGARPLPPAPKEVRVCNGPRCSGKGAHQLAPWLTLVQEASPGSPGSTAVISSCECLGECEFGPNMQLVPSGKVCNRTKKVGDVARALSLTLSEELLEELSVKAALAETETTGSASEAARGSSNAQFILAAAKAASEAQAKELKSSTAVTISVCQGPSCSKRQGGPTRLFDMAAVVDGKAMCIPGECMGQCKKGPNMGVEANVGAAGGRVDAMSGDERMAGCFIGVVDQTEMARVWEALKPVSNMRENLLQV